MREINKNEIEAVNGAILGAIIKVGKAIWKAANSKPAIAATAVMHAEPANVGADNPGGSSSPDGS